MPQNQTKSKLITIPLLLTLLLCLIPLTACSKQDRAEQYQHYLAEAGVYLANGRYERAIKAADKAIAADPGESGGYLAKGNAQFALGEMNKAIAAFNQAITIDPTSAEAYTQAGFVLRKQGQESDAAQAFNDAKAIYETRLSVLLNADPPLSERDLQVPMTKVQIAILTALAGNPNAAVLQLKMMQDEYEQYTGTQFWIDAIESNDLSSLIEFARTPKPESEVARLLEDKATSSAIGSTTDAMP